MTFESLAEIVFNEMKNKIESNPGLSIFSSERAKFEGWVKVELCESLSKYFKSIIPEGNRIDIIADDWAIELKTINTSFRFDNVKIKTRPIQKNVQAVIEDIDKLKLGNYKNKAVFFIVFPAFHNHEGWQYHLHKISALLKKLKSMDFNFQNGVQGVMYFGFV